MPKLTPEEIARRLQALRKYERLCPRLRRNYEAEKQKRRSLEQRLAEMEKEAEALRLQLEELRKMVFGSSKRRRDGPPPAGSAAAAARQPAGGQRPRPPASYRRPVPAAAEVTAERRYGVTVCPDCGGPLTDLGEAARYLEDILLPSSGRRNLLKTVTRETVATGFCPRCRQRRSAIPLAKQACRLGDNVRMRIVYAVTVLGMTFGKTASALKDTFSLAVSDGEIAAILRKEAGKLLPEYHDLGRRIAGAPRRHLDETGYPVQREGEGQWGWVTTASDTAATLFRLGRSRGKGDAALLSGGADTPAVTDDYAVYKHLWAKHALRWAHPQRKCRELADSAALSPRGKRQCGEFYAAFRRLFRQAQSVHRLPYDRQQRATAAGRFRRTIRALCAPDGNDPPKLAAIKAAFRENTEKYPLCIRDPDIPLTNNKAERALRPLVIERKLSFGSKTQKGADVMSVLLSVCFSLWWEHPESFYPAYANLIQRWHPG